MRSLFCDAAAFVGISCLLVASFLWSPLAALAVVGSLLLMLAWGLGEIK